MQMTNMQCIQSVMISSVGKGLYGRFIRRQGERYTGAVISTTNRFQVGKFMLLGLIDNVSL